MMPQPSTTLLQRVQDDIAQNRPNRVGTWVPMGGDVVLQVIDSGVNIFRQVGDRLLQLSADPTLFPVGDAVAILRAVPESVMSPENLSQLRVFFPIPLFGFDELMVFNPGLKVSSHALWRVEFGGVEAMRSITSTVFVSYRCERPQTATAHEIEQYLTGFSHCSILDKVRIPVPFVRSRYVLGEGKTNKPRSIYKWSELQGAARRLGHEKGFIEVENFEGTDAVISYENHYTVTLRGHTYSLSYEQTEAWFDGFCFVGEHEAQKHLYLSYGYPNARGNSQVPCRPTHSKSKLRKKTQSGRTISILTHANKTPSYPAEAFVEQAERVFPTTEYGPGSHYAPPRPHETLMGVGDAQPCWVEELLEMVIRLLLLDSPRTTWRLMSLIVDYVRSVAHLKLHPGPGKFVMEGIEFRSSGIVAKWNRLAWTTSFYLAVMMRAHDVIQDLSHWPHLDFDARHEPYPPPCARARHLLVAFFANRPDWRELYAEYMEQAADLYEWRSRREAHVELAALRMLDPIDRGDQSAFTLALADAVRAHRDFYSIGARSWTARSQMALEASALAAVAIDRGLLLEIDSGYLPDRFLYLRKP